MRAIAYVSKEVSSSPESLLYHPEDLAILKSGGYPLPDLQMLQIGCLPCENQVLYEARHKHLPVEMGV
ncbi:conserved hypothetical protein [Ricinus communis]|uniref:Uncharacterized protein n=1 Tax=Ricinus communis TaxID=3988 RepID=B9SBY0_RICCO|nr:conserved hypothetical protein [Ricinus communis]